MPYKCSNCDKEFLLKSRFRGHMRRKTKCTAQSSMDAFEKLVDVVEAKIEALKAEPSSEASRNYFENRLSDLELFFKNLPIVDQGKAKTLYEERLKSFFDNKLSPLT